MNEDIIEDPILHDEGPVEEPTAEDEVNDTPVATEPPVAPSPELEPEPEPEFITQVFYEEVYTIPEDCVEVAPPPFYKPRWDGEQWVEEGVRPADPPHVPTPDEKIAAQEDQITMLEMALVDSFEQSLELQTQNELAMVEMYELMFG